MLLELPQRLLSGTHQKAAVDSVHFPLWTYNPTTGKLKLDSAAYASLGYVGLRPRSGTSPTRSRSRRTRSRRARRSAAPFVYPKFGSKRYRPRPSRPALIHRDLAPSTGFWQIFNFFWLAPAGAFERLKSSFQAHFTGLRRTFAFSDRLGKPYNFVRYL